MLKTSSYPVKFKVFGHDAQTSGFEHDTHEDLGINFQRLISKEGESFQDYMTHIISDLIY